MASRWIRLEATWDESEWLAVLPGHAANCWPRVLCYVKTRGTKGSCKRPSMRVLAQTWRVDLADVENLERAAIEHGAIQIIDGNWVLTGWQKYQPSDATTNDRSRRYRNSKSRLSTSRASRRDKRDNRDYRDSSVARDMDIDKDKDIDRDEERSSTPTVTEEKETSGRPHPSAREEAGDQPADQRAAIEEMRVDLQLEIQKIEPRDRRMAFAASARGIVMGDELTAWLDPRGDGGGVPWPERPRLLRLAVDQCISEGNFGSQALRGALKLQILKQLAPFPPKVHPGSQAAAVRSAGPAAETPQGGGLRTGGGKLAAIGPTRETAKPDARIDAWSKANPDHAAALWADAVSAAEAEGAKGKLGEVMATASYRQAVLAMIGPAEPALKVLP